MFQTQEIHKLQKNHPPHVPRVADCAEYAIELSKEKISEVLKVDYVSGGGAMSESPPSDEGAAMMVRIFVGARTVDVGTSGIDEPSRDGTTDAASDDAALVAFDLLDLPDVGTDREMSLGKTKPDSPLLPATCPGAASSDSLSPTQDRANQRPPPIPRISRLAIRQCLGFLLVLSSGITGAEPE
jgi:hypothetical protein